jgi:hypothetical protein
MTDSEDIQIVFSQYAQDPFELPQKFDDSDLYKKVKNTIDSQKTKQRKGNTSNKIVKKSIGRPPCFVINNKAGKGSRLIKIQIIDIKDGVTDQNDDQNEKVLLNAQYVANDGYDDIIDSTEEVINKISKKMCGYSVNL